MSTSNAIVYSTVYSGADQRKQQGSALLAFVRVIHRWPVNSPYKGPVTRKMFPFDDVIMIMVWVPDMGTKYFPDWQTEHSMEQGHQKNTWVTSHNKDKVSVTTCCTKAYWLTARVMVGKNVSINASENESSCKIPGTPFIAHCYQQYGKIVVRAKIKYSVRNVFDGYLNAHVVSLFLMVINKQLIR